MLRTKEKGNMNQSRREGEGDGRLFDYAARIITLAEHLPSTRAGNHVAGQLLRAGTSSLPVPGSIQAAGSRDDLVVMLRTCLKDLQESRRWLRFIKHAALVQPTAPVDSLLVESESLIRIYAAS